MPTFEATISQTRSITISFKAKDEDAAQEILENHLQNPTFDADNLPNGVQHVSEDADDWEIEGIEESE